MSIINCVVVGVLLATPESLTIHYVELPASPLTSSELRVELANMVSSDIHSVSTVIGRAPPLTSCRPLSPRVLVASGGEPRV